MHDVVIVGGGPAGLSAALILGRCCRRVVVIDSGHPRNASALAMHGFISRDGTPPADLRQMARQEVQRYGVDWVDGLAISIHCSPLEEGAGRTAFEVTLQDGRCFAGRKLLLATGVVDVLPRIDGIQTFYGASVHHCPYCDAWEHRGQSIATVSEGEGGGERAAGLAVCLRTWTPRLTVCTQGETLPGDRLEILKRHGIAVRSEQILRLEGTGSQIERIVFRSGDSLPCQALFFNTGQFQRSMLPSQLGCAYNDEGHVVTHDKQQTRQKGFFLAGDADGDVQFVIIAAAEGARAAVGINRELQDEDE